MPRANLGEIPCQNGRESPLKLAFKRRLKTMLPVINLDLAALCGLNSGNFFTSGSKFDDALDELME
jgi:hypothetical protein